MALGLGVVEPDLEEAAPALEEMEPGLEEAGAQKERRALEVLKMLEHWLVEAVLEVLMATVPTVPPVPPVYGSVWKVPWVPALWGSVPLWESGVQTAEQFQIGCRSC